MDTAVKDRIRDSIAVGLRKGCDSPESSRYYGALNPLFFNPDESLQNVAMEHVEAIAVAAEAKWNKGLTTTVSQAMKDAACVHRLAAAKDGFNISPSNQGVECFRKMLPLQWEDFQIVESINPDGEPDGHFHQFITGRADEPRYDWVPEGWRNYKFINRSSSEVEIAGALILALAEKIPQVREFFANELATNPEVAARQNLYEAACGMTDEDWRHLAYWCMH